MKRVFKAFAVAVAGIAVALLAPAGAWAACPGSVQITHCASGVVLTAPLRGDGVTPNAAGGTWWMVGTGNDATGPGDTSPGFGDDAGALAGFPQDPTPFNTWLLDFIGDNTTRCIFWDWS